MKFDFKRYITGQIIVIVIFFSGFIFGSIITFQATKTTIEQTYDCFPRELGLFK